jgi:signal transduction histidine kinase
MTERGRAGARAAVIAGGLAVAVGAILSVRSEDWPIYLTFFVVSGFLFLPGVEVMPRVQLAIAEMAATIGFVYVAGPPIILVRLLSPLLTRRLRRLLPQSWAESLPPFPAYHLFDLIAAKGAERTRLLAEWATFAIGLGVRWWVASSLVSGAPPVTGAGSILVAEIIGYATWGLLSGLAIYPDRPLMPAEDESVLAHVGRAEAKGMALSDMTLVVALALTPFVFLIAYAYEVHGLDGATGWAVGALGLHFMLKRLHERRVRLEEQNRRLEALNRELEHRERLSAIGKMSSVVSHQILQQLGVIGLHADLIRNADEGNADATLEKTRANAAAIEGALQDVNRVLTDLLVFSRDLRLNLYDHALERVVAEAVGECRASAEKAGVRLRVDAPSGAQVTLDKLKIRQAVVNVVRNAIEASPRGSEVAIAAAATDAGVTLTVQDSGPGVAEKDRDAVFTPFFTTKEQGTGLGLAIARAFIEAHGGRVWVDSAGSPPGAKFTIELPRGAKPAGA